MGRRGRHRLVTCVVLCSVFVVYGLTASVGWSAFSPPPRAPDVSGSLSPRKQGPTTGGGSSAQPIGAFPAIKCDGAEDGASCCHSRNRFLFFGNSFGRHHNQMASFAAATVLAQQTNRTLVVPPFSDGGTRALRLADMYDVASLLDPASGLCIITAEEFAEREAQPVDATCVTMRGISTHPQRVAGLTIKCSRETHIRYKKRLELFYSTVAHDPAVHAARVITLPLAIYYAEVLPPAHVAAVWQRIRPHAVVTAGLAALDTCLASLATNRPIAGIHFRSLEGSCVSRVREVAGALQPAARDALVRQCEMDPQELKVMARAASNITTDHFFVIADDGQQAERARPLSVALGGFRLQEVSTRCPEVPEAMQKARERHSTKAGAAYWAMSLDFWVLVRAELFFGNQLSTLSANVCRRRRGDQRKCTNFVDLQRQR